MNRGKAAILALVGAAVFIIPNSQSLEGVSFAPTFHAADPLYFLLLVIGSVLSAASVYASALWE